MMMRRARFGGLLGILVSLAGCVTVPGDGMAAPSRPVGDTCRAEPGQAFIGRQADAATGAELLRITNSREIRWVAPGMAVTADYKYGRLTVGYDEAMIIRSVACT